MISTYVMVTNISTQKDSAHLLARYEKFDLSVCLSFSVSLPLPASVCLSLCFSVPPSLSVSVSLFREAVAQPV